MPIFEDSLFKGELWEGSISEGSIFPGKTPRIYVVDPNGVERYVKTGETEFSSVTRTASYTIYYYEILSDGTRIPENESQYSNTGPNALSAGTNAPIAITGTEFSATVVMNREDTFTITTTGGTAIGTIPVIESAISGGAWSITPPGETLLPSYQTQSPIEEGDNTVTMQYTDGNGDVFTSSNTIAVRYASTAPIVEIDGQDIQTDIQTENYQVTVTYLYGGSLIFDAGEQVTDLGETVYYGGVLVDVTNYGLLPAGNNVQVAGETDDFGQSFDTTTEPCTKIPAIINNGLTTIDEETYGTTYAATNILTIDAGAAYETTATPTEAPYTFTSGDYKVYNFTASYTYPATSVSNSVAYDITYKEFAVTPYANKVWDVYSEQEFRLDGTENTGLSENNTHPTGLGTLTYRATPSFTDSTDALYTGTPATYFDQVPSAITGFTVPTSDSPYLSSVGNLLVPQQQWGIGGWFFTNSASSSPFCKGGSVGAQITRLFISSTGDVRPQIGGTLSPALTNVDQTAPNFYYMQHYNNGTDWAIDVYVNGVMVAENQTTSIGTNTNDLAPLLMGVWAVSSQVDPDTDAQNHPGGGWVSNVHITSQKLTEKQINGLYYRNTNYYLHGVNGDSMSVNNFGGNASWAVQYENINNTRLYRTSVINIAVAGRTSTQAGVESPTDSFEVKPSWYPGGTLPPITTEQSAEFERDTFDPDLVMYLFSWLNDGNNDYYNKNSNAATPPADPSEIGVNGYADMFLYEVLKLQNFWSKTSTQMWVGGPTPQYNTVDTRTQDTIIWQNAQGVTNDEIVAYAAGGNLENFIELFSQLVNTGTYQPDSIHYDNPTSDVHWNQTGINNVGEPSFRAAVEPTTIASRDRDFDPVVLPITLQDGDTVYIPTFDFTWSRDGIEVTEEITLTEGANTIARNYTNTADRTGGFSISVTYEVYDVPSVVHLPMDQIVQDGSDFKFEDSELTYDALVFGDRTITNNRWVTTQTGADYCYMSGAIGQDWFKPVTAEFSASITLTLDATTNNRIFGVHPVANGEANGLSVVSSQFRYKHGGITTTFGVLITPYIGVATHYGIAVRFVNPSWEVDLYIDGVKEATITMTGTNYNATSAPIVSGSFLNDSDFTAGADENIDGKSCNFRYYTQAIPEADWPKIASIDKCV